VIPGYLLDKLLVIIRRDLMTALRYRTAFAANLFSLVVEILGLYFLAKAVGQNYHPDHVDYFPFLLVGTGFYSFLVLGIGSFVDSVREAQVTGTMEVLMTTSTGAPTVIFLTAVSAFGGRVLRLVAFLAAGFLIFRIPLGHPNVVGCLVVFLLSVLIAISIGIAAAAVQIAVQRGGAALTLFASLTWLITGVMFPVSALPVVLQPIARALPFTQSLNGLRFSLLHNASLRELSFPISVLAIYLALLLPLSLVLLATALRNARLRGTLSFY
jgi:ABC-2 type transport system permease protein